jgi:hypothetical protein
VTDAVFPSHITSALDRLTVPSLPAGFAERLLARIAAGDLPAEGLSETPSLPAARRPVTTARRWFRPGRILVGAGLLGIATATAAASGVFGEPVYVPLVSEALAKAEIVPVPAKPALAKKEKPAAKPVVAEKEPAKGSEAVHQLYERLRSDKEFRSLPQPERAAIAREELQAMLHDGTIKPEDIRQAMRELRAARVAKAQALREAAGRSDPAQQNKAPPQRKVPPEVVAKRRAAVEAMPREERRRLFELRRALRTAPPMERPAIRREIRAILQDAQENLPPAEGNAEPLR